MNDLTKQMQTSCTTDQWTKLLKFLDLVKEWNKKINLVSRKDIDQLIEHHLAPCLAFSTLGRIKAGENILDIGSGGGFPGLVNAILFPQTKFTLVDARKKKVDALNDMIKQLQLENATAYWGRIEELGEEKKWNNAFDRTTSRAVAPLADLYNWSLPFIKSEGTVEALKGGDVSAEVLMLTADKKIPATAVTLHLLSEEWGLSERLSDLVIVSIKKT
ncbi:MAG: 16S rRNA (guanine(527)-N(7))-methyltransferase RsmG [Candidatus Kerfeldbacteria bacterium CG15_BIG_FIL_POST_REV_8_21_14_020_45_12]|uniref:Ribosomal RNA small subunit methyltransferase G n=1 Tax=Candidatus Kerfeldbacteria bacterium CG15_BIG_FIL_POST_REV_8_21_14_020_45_12 TaxID=2014247 RepID=A0A2M7H2L7_9BACT|nr:MAG: 16S rRNA (guanine(527)-N(7))-methyltransferase RsmG [Candidatus Kerfeldbacteria bacterium CG15_BIG_FIL_POST_REV_8_21_14_020_45_12]PJA92825.1 MAG: 16S rRNA (guanine(527)-N(7))-methyltransferase RsmG [Candidatus Kerfeldbacteria bacterium CG_4_9_14_3_um_filter_45_8]